MINDATPPSYGCNMGSRSSASLASATERDFLMRRYLPVASLRFSSC